jgi:hypothetical protein
MSWFLFFSPSASLICFETMLQITLLASTLLARILNAGFAAIHLAQQSSFPYRTVSLITFPGIPMHVWSSVYSERIDI